MVTLIQIGLSPLSHAKDQVTVVTKQNMLLSQHNLLIIRRMERIVTL